MLPIAVGPPDVKSALTSVLSELTVYTPGLRASPRTNTWIEPSWPSVTERSKLLYCFRMAARMVFCASFKRKPATLMVPIWGTNTCPFLSTVLSTSILTLPQARTLSWSPEPMT